MSRQKPKDSENDSNNKTQAFFIVGQIKEKLRKGQIELIKLYEKHLKQEGAHKEDPRFNITLAEPVFSNPKPAKPFDQNLFLTKEQLGQYQLSFDVPADLGRKLIKEAYNKVFNVTLAEGDIDRESVKDAKFQSRVKVGDKAEKDKSGPEIIIIPGNKIKIDLDKLLGVEKSVKGARRR
jgi:hypothetical protein